VSVAELVLRYVEALAWPVVVGTVAFYLREPLQGLVRKVRKASFGGAEVNFAEREEASLRAELEESAPLLGAVDPPAAPADAGAPSEPEDAPPSATSPEGALATGGVPDGSGIRVRREAIEDLVRKAAEWGQARGEAGLDVSGTRIEWGGAAPRLHTPPAPSLTTSPKAAKRRDNSRRVWAALAEELADNPYAINLEKRAAELTSRLARAKAGGAEGGFIDRLALEQELDDVRSKLRQVHPTSGYL